MRIRKILFAAGMAAVLTQSTPGAAQPARPAAATSESTAIVEKVRELYNDGMKAASRGKWADAHAALLAAWSLKQQYQIAGNLGSVEVQLGKYRQAAEHLSFYVREAPKEKVAEKQRAAAQLAEVRTKVAALSFAVAPTGAEVRVDGVVIGKAPIEGEVFVDPGAHTIEARLEKYEIAKVLIEVTAGASREVPLKLTMSTPTRGGPGIDRDARGPAPGSAVGAVSSSGGGTTASESGDRSKGLIIAGATTSAAALGTGIILMAVAGAKATAKEERITALRQETGKSGSCRAGPPSESEGCAELHDLASQAGLYRSVGFWMILTGGALGAGTAIYALTGPTSAAKKRMAIAPIAMGNGGGVLVTGSW